MKRSFVIPLIALLSLYSVSLQGQVKDSLQTTKKVKSFTVTDDFYNPLSPSKAAFYSAIFPGGGQIYNKKYWKAPIVWGAMATSVYFYLDNNSEYKRYRSAFKQREAGLQDEFTLDNGTVLISRTGLINAQKVLRNNRDLSLLTTLILYALQVVEASVNAHLIQFNTSDDLSLRPIIVPDPVQIQAPTFGLSLTYTF